MNPASMVTKSLLRDMVNWISSIRRSTWLIIGLITMAGLTFIVWAAITVFGWFFGMAREGANAAPAVFRAVTEQFAQSIPGADHALETLRTVVPVAPPARDVSGTDPVAVPRYPGLTRSSWQQDGREVTVQYEGPADYFAVLDHYVKGFTRLGYTQRLISAATDREHHEYRKDQDRVSLSIVRTDSRTVKVGLVTELP